MRARDFCSHPSIRDHWAHEHMSRSGGQSEARPQCLRSQASSVLIYRSTAGGITAVSTLPISGIDPVVWKRDTLPLDHRALRN
ncbi:hypothetical protein TNCV_604441 [Trichonephila clavipes]|nr:hypothetical protein TNCV_604441 [Trichonephila clavipes]